MMKNMKFTFESNKIHFSKEINSLDEMAIYFSKRLSAQGIKHVFLSGYVAILFGRNRASEDIDVITEPVSFDTFNRFWDDIYRNMECIITSDVHTAFEEYLIKDTAVRFAKKGDIMPNVEMKFAKTLMHRKAIASPVEVFVNRHRIPISPLEQQIAYKLYMGSEKDIEDARFLFKLFDEHLVWNRIVANLKTLKVPLNDAKRDLGWHK